MIVQPDMLYGMETMLVTSSHVRKLEVTDMKMGMRQVRNDNIRERLKVESITGKCD